MRHYYVYILANTARTMYVGVTNDLARRLQEQRGEVAPAFCARYGIHELVYYEETGDVRLALAREQQIKAWRRSRKVALVETMNPEWRDLSAELFGAGSPGKDRTVAGP